VFRRRTTLALVIGALGPVAVCAAIFPLRHRIPNADSALILVTLIVGVAVLGVRAAGLVSAVSAGLGFDLLLTPPYGSLKVHAAQDVGTLVLLIIVGIAVTEIAAQGWRQHGRAEQHSAYLAGLHQACEAVAAGGSPTQLSDRVAAMLVPILGLASCRFELGPGVENPCLQPDGNVTWGEYQWDVDGEGLPLSQQTVLVVRTGGRTCGRFLMTPTVGARPGRTQRLVAVALADQVGSALSSYEVGLG
jgi:hypothetical protein